MVLFKGTMEGALLVRIELVNVCALMIGKDPGTLKISFYTSKV